MRKLLLVAKHDVKMTLRQRSFWILTLIMPLILMASNAASFLGNDSDDGGALAGLQGLTEPATFGLVDEAGLIDQVPAELAGLLVRFDDAEAARAAMAAGAVGEYAVLPADYLATGRLDVYGEEVQPLGTGAGGTAGTVVPYLVALNLTGDPVVAAALNNPTPGSLAARHDLAPAREGEGNNRAMGEMVAQILPLMYYFLLIMGSNYLMRSVVAEKENRTVEMLLLSVEPKQMMVGKILAASVLILIQVVVWVGGGMLLLNRGAQVMNLAGGFSFPPDFVVWAVLFLVLGFLLYASVMAAAGAMSNTAREAGQMTVLLIVPLLPTMMFAQVFVDEPNGPLAVALSLFPFSAPSAMVTRLALAEVPLWQILLSLAGLAVTTYLFVTLAARFFRPGNLLSSQAFHWRRLLTGWRAS